MYTNSIGVIPTCIVASFAWPPGNPESRGLPCIDIATLLVLVYFFFFTARVDGKLVALGRFERVRDPSYRIGGGDSIYRVPSHDN